jgi:hypothetical protein
MLDWGKLRRPLTPTRVKAQWAEYERAKAQRRRKVRGSPSELTSLLALERARSLELRTAIIRRTLLDNAQVGSDIYRWIAALRDGLYIAVANLDLAVKRAGEDGADAIMGRLSQECGEANEGLLASLPELPPPAEPPAALSAKQHEQRARLLYRRMRNDELAAKMIGREGAETLLRELGEAARRELAVADIGTPLGEVIEASRALVEQIINEWRAGVEENEEDNNDDDE